MPPTPFDAPLLSIGERLDELRHLLAHLDTLQQHPRATELSRTSRAWAYVAMAAALEEFIRQFIDEMATHINAAQVKTSDLGLGLVSLLQAPAFDSAAMGRRQAMWDKRADVLKVSESSSVAALPIGVRPLDGRTIRQSHLDSLWAIYGLPGGPLPSALHSLALRDLSDGRNEVAHGNAVPATFGRTKTYQDVMRRVEQVEDIAVHLAGAGATYVAAKGYLR